MRRIVIWLAATVTIVVLLFGYHTSTDRTAVTGAGAAPGREPSSSAPAPTTGGAPTTRNRKSAHTSTGGARSTPAQRSSAPTRTATTTWTGAVAQTRWGPVQVKVTARGHTITAVDVPVYPHGNPHDDEINSYALPQLVSETLNAQSARIDMVSGATVTSDGYLSSLQSALDQAGW